MLQDSVAKMAGEELQPKPENHHYRTEQNSVRQAVPHESFRVGTQDNGFLDLFESLLHLLSSA